MINNDEIVVLILSTKDEKYLKFKNAIQETWMKQLSLNNIKCFFYEGGHEKNEISNDLIKLKIKDDLQSTSIKVIESFKLIIDKYPTTKVVYRTNLSSFIDVEVFLKFIKYKNIGINSYCGIIGKTNYLKEYFYGNKLLSFIFSFLNLSKKIYFSSGSGFFIGINNISKLLLNPQKIDLIDDVMIGYNLNLNLLNQELPIRFDIKEDNTHKVSINEYIYLVNEKLLFHYRFKTKNRLNDSKLLYNFKDQKFREEFCTHK
jgi:hypothetical protein